MEGLNKNFEQTVSKKIGFEETSPYFLQEQIRLPKNQWSEEFKKIIEDKIQNNLKEQNIESVQNSEILQEITFKRYINGLEINEIELKDKKILDLGTGDGEFIKYLIEKHITREAFGIDISFEDKKIEKDLKNNFIERNFEEEIPIKNLDYIVSVGSVTNGIWGGEEILNISKVIKNSLDSLKDNGEIRIYPIQESAKETPLSGIDISKEKWIKILGQISNELNIKYELKPRDIQITGYDNDIILNYVLIIKK